MGSHSRFAWHDMNSSDVEASAAFYTTLFGWTIDDEPRPNGYRLLKDGGEGFGGIFPWPEKGPERSRWSGYVLVEDVVETANRARSLGGRAPFDAMPIPDVGTLGIVIDPAGAAVTTFRPDEWADTWVIGPAGTGETVLWNELISTDLAVSTAFHRDLFGWEVDPRVVEAGGYVIARAQDQPVAGIFRPPAAPASSDWITYFNVREIDDMVNCAEELGAKIAHPATDVRGVGRTAWLLDTNGAIFGPMQPEEGWFERL